MTNPEAAYAHAIASQWGDVRGVADLAASTQDRVFKVTFSDGRVSVLKVSSSDRVNESQLHAESAAMRHVGEALPWLQVPLLEPDRDGTLLVSGPQFTARMMAWIDGHPLERAPHWTSESLRALGRTAGHVSRVLQDFSHDGVPTRMEWDPRRAVSVVRSCLPSVPAETRALLESAIASFKSGLARAEESRLPEQVVHLDLTDRNVLGWFDVEGRFEPQGVIDFGDLVRSWRICELAVAVHAAISRSRNDPLATAAPVVEGFVSAQPLTSAEAEHLWSAVLARAATCVAIECAAAAREPDNDHVRELAEDDTAVLRAALVVQPDLARATLMRACNAAPGRVDLVDRLHQAGAARIVTDSAVGVHQRWHEVVLLTDEAAGNAAPDALHLGVACTLAAGATLVAPVNAQTCEATESSVTLKLDTGAEPAYLYIDGVVPVVHRGQTVRRGDNVAHAGTPTGAESPSGDPVFVQLRTVPAAARFGKVRDREAWSLLCPDPSALLGIDSPEAPQIPALEARSRHVAAAQHLYYRRPPVMVRAHGQWMYDDTGRRYLDMVNNVAIVGHSHPRVAAAAADQMALLNTNSRFLYRAIGEYADRIAATLPPELSQVMLVNSGSEAMELALQLARKYSGHKDIVALQGAYHGWTTEVFELCTMPADRPNWRSELAPFVHIAASPDWYRGEFGSLPQPYLDTLSDACESACAGGGLAGFVHEPVSGSRGGVVYPPGYLRDAYEIVRRHGGVVIADEVQVGFARTGQTFWAFQADGVVPDIVASAKAAGNGHPVGFVACRTEIAEAFARDSTFFSTPAGNPVSCRIGATVLDVIRDESLQDNARTVGDHLARRLGELSERHPVIGAVYGRGLYQGIDLVAGDGSNTPLSSSAVAGICERLLEIGCIVAPTGLFGNVLKVKPPLCINQSDADRFVSAVDQVLTERAEFSHLSPGTESPTKGAFS